ncbi:uncharacterized protein LOC116015825 [Ipomoea triloba]|uniref:uncharacterized protein LOC116015825 n=1 Tax=Ipomoea triloba TaxID=35885 RepID=UPI00125D2B71|nr:uncharacterized protein LOC116015825 [Ipomoea triloba]
MSAANIVGKSKKELYDIMCEMKKLMEQNEEQARQILIENPTLARDLFKAQIMLGMVQPTQPSPSHKDGDTIECFTLGDLWDCYEEWSVYGVGVPVILNSGESVTQYYVPYLFAIQIYTNKPQQTSGNQKENEGVASIEGRKKTSPQTMRGMIAELAEVHPGLMTFKSTDLSPASWISVAWYPIYQIPTKENHKDRLSTCFLTYHALSSSSIRGGVKLDKDGDKKGKKVLEMVKGKEGNNNIKKSTGDVLYPYPFGLATYRLDDEIWINGNTFDDYERIIDLYNAAECWLKRLNVWHHDFNFFTSKLSLQGLSI